MYKLKKIVGSVWYLGSGVVFDCFFPDLCFLSYFLCLFSFLFSIWVNLFCNHLDREESARNFPLTFLLMYFDSQCPVALPRGAVGLSAVFDCGIT